MIGTSAQLRAVLLSIGMLTIPLVVSPLKAQTEASSGDVTGRVVNTETGEPVPLAQVMLDGTERGVVTDLDGRYVMRDVPAGVVTLAAQSLGFGQKRVTEVTVESGGTTILDITLEPVALELEAITVTAEAEAGATAAVLNVRRNSQVMLDAIGSQQISRLPASDAADVALRMPGVTVAEGRYVYVRGLGERYSQTSLNGSPLPSPEPEKEVVPLDLFPSQFLESITTQKTYTPDQPADFSGGTVQIQTKDFPEQMSGSFGMSTTFNTQSSFQDGFLTYPGGGRDFLGIDDGTRGLPDIINQQLGGLTGDRVPSDPATRQALGLAFPRRFSPASTTTPLSRAFDASLGSRAELFGKEVGFLVGGTYSDGYTISNDDVERKFRTSSFDPSIPEDRRVPNVEYAFDRGTRNVRIGAVGNLTFLLTPVHKIGIRGTFDLNTDDEARTYQGTNSEDLGGLVRSDRLRFVSRKLYWGQLTGEDQLFFDSHLEWRATFARARRDEPGLRETIYLNDSSDPLAPYYLENVGDSGRYLYDELVDDDGSLEADWRFPFDVWSGLSASVKVGGAYRDRTRDFAARRFNWNFQNGVVTDVDAALSDQTIVGRVTGPNQFAISDIVEPGDQYQAYDHRRAGYLMFELPFTDRVRTTFGARVEKYDLSIDSRGANQSGLHQTDILPAVNLTLDLNAQMTLRAGFSQTLDRPEFRELAPFQFTEASSLRQIFGNPNLQVATIRSADLRWDWFPRFGEVLSVSAFYKHFDKPIEQVWAATASAGYSFQNAKDAWVVGTEFEVNRRLDILSEALNDLTFQGNLSLVKSRVNVVRSGFFDPTNLDRALEGQAAYSLNLGLQYQSTFGGTQMGVFYNRFGERLTTAGGSGIPDIIEQPRNQVDAVIEQGLPRGIRAKIKLANLLDDAFVYQQSANGITEVQRRYKTGANISVSLVHEF